MSSDDKRRWGAVHGLCTTQQFQPVKEMDATPFCGIDNGPHPGDEQATGIALGPERALAPQDGRAQRPLGVIIGRRNALHIDECPQCVPVFPQVL